MKRSESEFRNVFEIWDSIGGVVPFKFVVGLGLLVFLSKKPN